MRNLQIIVHSTRWARYKFYKKINVNYTLINSDLLHNSRIVHLFLLFFFFFHLKSLVTSFSRRHVSCPTRTTTTSVRWLTTRREHLVAKVNFMRHDEICFKGKVDRGWKPKSLARHTLFRNNVEWVNLNTKPGNSFKPSKI